MINVEQRTTANSRAKLQPGIVIYTFFTAVPNSFGDGNCIIHVDSITFHFRRQIVTGDRIHNAILFLTFHYNISFRYAFK